MTRPVSRRRRGTPLVIAVFLVASGVARLGGGTGEAIAREFAAIETPAANSAPALHCEPDPDVAGLLQAIEKREEKLKLAESALADRMQALAVAEAEIQANLQALTEAEAALSETLAFADRAAEDDLSRLTAVYEAMKPAEAAALFETMAPDFAAGFMGRMRADAAAAILAGLSPDMAYSISVILAGRNANVPKE